MNALGTGAVVAGAPVHRDDRHGPDAFCNPYFRARQVMVASQLEAIFELRYQVYCVERGFLDPADYPDRRERDGYDDLSLHYGLYSLDDELAGTMRLVRGRLSQLPLVEHCPLAADAERLLAPLGLIGEISRLAVSRNFRRRTGDGFYSLQVAPPRQTLPRGDISATPERRGSAPFVLHLYREAYQACRRSGINFLLAAVERPLARLLNALGFTFEQIGPEVDYYGPVAPFMLDLDRFDRLVVRRRAGLLRFLAEGLEPSLYPPPLRLLDEAPECTSQAHPSQPPA
ncbi:MAG: PEP-CTERM/exosortase system-associated acyltransferase [Alphaproteobacteria bacterium]|nr:PEP-CTERM/exosortase system-associated acyltransferase [Alphaproteobacteria bacterium]